MDSGGKPRCCVCHWRTTLNAYSVCVWCWMLVGPSWQAARQAAREHRAVLDRALLGRRWVEGYCSECHEVQPLGPDERCPACGTQMDYAVPQATITLAES